MHTCFVDEQKGMLLKEKSTCIVVSIYNLVVENRVIIVECYDEHVESWDPCIVVERQVFFRN